MAVIQRWCNRLLGQGSLQQFAMKRNVVNRDTLPPVFSERDTSAGDEPFSLMMRAMGIAASAMLEDIGNNIPVPENPRRRLRNEVFRKP
jgi:hypothetical protein